MYESFYQLASNPFRLAPDPNFCFTHAGYKRAREYLEYALAQGEGFVMVTGRPGTGKTMLAETFLQGIDTGRVTARRITASNYSADDLLRAVAYAYELDAAQADKATVRHLIQEYFLQQEAAGRRVLLIIDEAQALQHTALEELRIMADLQTQSRQMLQLFLIGQESLQTLMRTPDMEQFQQRVIANYHLVPLNLLDTRAYIEHRLVQAGWEGAPSFTAAAVQAVHQLSRGVPRHINKICNRLMLLGYGKGTHQLDESDVSTIAAEMQDELLAPMEGVHPVSNTTEQPEVRVASPDLAINLENLDEKARAIARASRTAVQRKAAFEQRHGRGTASWSGQPDESLLAYPAGEAEAQTLPPASVVATAKRSTRRTLIGRLADTIRWRETLMVSGATLALTTIAVAALPTLIGVYNSTTTQPLPEVSQATSDDVPPIEQPPAVASVPPVAVLPDSQPAIKRTDEAPGKESVAETQPEITVRPAVVASLETLPAPAADAQRDFTRVALNAPSISYTTGIRQALPDAATTPAAGPADEVEVPEPEGQTRSASGLINRDNQPGTASDAMIAATKTTLPELLAQGQRALDDYRLMTPADDSAYVYFRAVLQQDPGNAVAKAGMHEIVDRYVVLSRKAAARGEVGRAQRYIDRGLSIEPRNRALLALQDDLRRPLIQLAAEQPLQREVPPVSGRVTLSEQDNKEDVVSRITDFFRKRKAEAAEGVVTTPAGWDG